MDGHGLVQGVIGNEVQDRRKGFGAHDRHAGVGADDGRLHEIAGLRQDLAAAQELSAFGLGGGDGRRIARHGAAVDQRSHQRVRLERVADAHLPIRRNQAPLELGGARAMHQYAARGGAALTGGSHRAKNDAGHRQVEIRRVVDDDGVVAAQLEQALAQPLGNLHADLPAHMSRAGERNQRHAAVSDEAHREFGAGVDENLKDRRQRVALQHTIADVLHGEGAQRGLGRGLPHGGIAADRRQERVPGPHRHGEVECGYHPHDTERMPLLVHAVLGPFGVHGEAVQHARLADGEIGDIDHLLDLAHALGLDLAVLQGHEAAERVLVLAQLLAHEPHGLPALRRRHQPPGRGRGHGCGHHILVVFRRRAANLRQAFAGGRIERVYQRPGGLPAPALAAGPRSRVDVAKSQRLQGVSRVLHK